MEVKSPILLRVRRSIRRSTGSELSLIPIYPLRVIPVLKKIEMEYVLVDDVHNEPTMGDKFESLNLLSGENLIIEESNKASAPGDYKPPTAASVNVLLRQALHADDRSLLLDCLYNRDEHVIANSVAKLNSADVFKLLNSLLPILQSRGAILACTIPWIKCLLLTHSSGLISQESSLLALNSMHRLIESRVSSHNTAIEVSSSLDLIVDDLDEEEEDTGPVIYEDKDCDEEKEEELEEPMETTLWMKQPMGSLILKELKR